MQRVHPATSGYMYGSIPALHMASNSSPTKIFLLSIVVYKDLLQQWICFLLK